MQIKTYLNTTGMFFSYLYGGCIAVSVLYDGAADKILSQVSLHASLRYIYGDI